MINRQVSGYPRELDIPESQISPVAIIEVKYDRAPDTLKSQISPVAIIEAKYDRHQISVGTTLISLLLNLEMNLLCNVHLLPNLGIN